MIFTESEMELVQRIRRVEDDISKVAESVRIMGQAVDDLIYACELMEEDIAQLKEAANG